MEHQLAVSPTYTSAIDDYLKAIYILGQKHGDVTTSLLATYLGFAPPSVTGMVQKLAKLKFPGQYMFHAHQSEFSELGWLGIFDVPDTSAAFVAPSFANICDLSAPTGASA
jgi:hypothetical protein